MDSINIFFCLCIKYAYCFGRSAPSTNQMRRTCDCQRSVPSAGAPPALPQGNSRTPHSNLRICCGTAQTVMSRWFKRSESQTNQCKRAIDAVASYFCVLSESTRTRIMGTVCEAENTVSQIDERIGASQTDVLMYPATSAQCIEIVIAPNEEPDLIWNSTNCAAF